MAKCDREDVARMVLAAQAGDGAALEALVIRFRATALLVARQTCADAEIAEDAVQDGLLTAFRALCSLQDPAQFGPWLAAIVRNRARRLAGDGYRRRSMPLHEADRKLVERIPPLAMPPLSSGEDLIRGLPPGIRETMLLYYFEGWSVGETAALLERPLTTVKWQLHAGRTLLRKRLDAHENKP